MKKIVLTAISALFCVAIYAQDIPNAEQAKAATERFKSELGLTDEQAAKYEPILLKRLDKVDAIIADTTLSKDERAQKRSAAVAAADKEFEKIFTPEQFKAYKASIKKTPINVPAGAKKPKVDKVETEE